MKKFLTKYIVLALAPLALWSCSDEEKGEVIYSSGEGRLSLKVSPLSTVSAGIASETKEVVKSLRIVMTDSEGKIKANEYFSYTDKDANRFSEAWTYTGVQDEYDVYLIANEESVEDFTAEGLDARWQGDIKAAIDSYKLGQTGFESFINSLSFTPVFTPNDNSVALPMTAYYKLKLDDKEKNYDLYLVNGACKFIINFTNYRNDEVTVSEVKFSNAASSSYLMANIDEEFQTFKELYWIDWMKGVADATKPGGVNQTTNESWGWLTGYNLPAGATHAPVVLLSSEDESWVVSEQELVEGGEPIAGELKDLGPFYLPESKNAPGNDGTQSYTLEFKVAIPNAEPATISKNLGNLKTMFRNTRVTLNIELYAGKEDIYVEFGDWNERQAFGTIKPL